MSLLVSEAGAEPASSAPRTLAQWLAWQEALHLSAIDLGLDRIRVVAERMDLLQVDFPIITVAGTNGKGSTVALLSALCQSAGYRVGAYTSPHILRYNERIAVAGKLADDELICAAFAAIDAARGEVSLTYFEFGSLAAMWIFRQQAVELAILEVGLGGRLDAANLWDADVAVITGIGIDHVSWLGDNREVIGREKAGIARAGRPLVCGDPEPPESIGTIARELGAEYWQIGRDWQVELSAAGDSFSVRLQQDDTGTAWVDLPLPALPGTIQTQNAGCALLALWQLRQRFPLPRSAIEHALQHVQLAGRLQRLQTAPDVYVDVAHNPHAARYLADWLQKNPTSGRTYVLFSILSDKDIDGVVEALRTSVDEWHFFALPDARAMPLEDIHRALSSHDHVTAVSHEGLKQAWTALKPCLNSNDRVVAFGSFLVVSSMLEDFV
ncbi:MAG: bifunctional tetrahydrofolate synthase/dihydrofolate synthase [Thiolinea sp.]